METASCLSLTGITKTFGGLHAIEGVDLEMRVGERRAVIGPNGAGKTTLFNLISGELLPNGGNISLFGKDVTRVPIHKRIAMGLARTFQVTNLFPELSVLENLLLAAQGTDVAKFVMYRPLSSYRRFYEVAEKTLLEFGLQEERDTLIKNLSHGEQRQVEVCMALIGQPRLLLLDEPTAGLSPAETQSFTVTLNNIDPGITVLLIEHDMDVAFELSDSITVLSLGQLVVSGTAEDIKNNATVKELYFGTG